MQLPAIETLLDALVVSTRAHLAGHGIAEPLLVGIHSAGVWLAQHLACALGQAGLIGELDISFYRDDFTRVGMHPTVRPSRIPFEVEGRHLLLVDDVLYTGRTIRAALNELFDYGRPASVTLAVLISRNGRELPIEASACGARLALPARQQVKLRGPAPLRLELVERG
ncbi:MAG: bifunctional pyr operon transcriptional regulator/uracil phosphoribosyltransferase PyrR [Xanthomonadales bacterium]|nr:Bifunctional protein PyrR [Xanthomonadales bacterium]MCC6593595.1 bifunctional pyr operon transcriptional regulator/uracil phosphoribosyltransferase PyrR [Xanthomonadales bacterium]MCE7931761.1 bifunctional pyr operon transcriptional regulator/uracil phosphoribosyltransferase PyrR [Xanthomonadales bacterium PRO6]